MSMCRLNGISSDTVVDKCISTLLPFGTVQRHARAPEQRLRRHAVDWIHRDANAWADVELEGAHPERRRHRIEQPPRPLTQLLAGRYIREHTRELFVPQSAHGVLDPHRLGQPRGNNPEQFIAGFVSVRVVGRFEAVEVDAQHGLLCRLNQKRRKLMIILNFYRLTRTFSVPAVNSKVLR